MEPVLLIKDHKDVLQITFQDMAKYHGREFIGGVALAFKLLELAFDQLSPAEPPAREKFSILIGVQGPGIIDGVEMVTRAKSRAAMIIDPQTASTKPAPDAADGCGGRYYFEIMYNNRKHNYSLKHGLLPAEFITLAYKTHDGTLTDAEATRLARLKEEIAGFLLARPAASLFDVAIM